MFFSARWSDVASFASRRSYALRPGTMLGSPRTARSCAYTETLRRARARVHFRLQEIQQKIIAKWQFNEVILRTDATTILQSSSAHQRQTLAIQ